jgi:hypothetical protein
VFKGALKDDYEGVPRAAPNKLGDGLDYQWWGLNTTY